MNNKKAALLWKNNPDDRKKKDIAFKAILNNNRGVMSVGWFTTFKKLVRFKVADPQSHKKAYQAHLEDLTINFIDNKFDPDKGSFLGYYKWIVRASVDKYIRKAFVVKTKDSQAVCKTYQDGNVIEKKRRGPAPIYIIELNAIDPISGREIIEDLASEEEEQYDGINHYVGELLCNVSNIEQDILKKYYGIGGNRPLTLREVGDQYGLSHERIRQIIDMAKKKIRMKYKNNKSVKNSIFEELHQNYLVNY